MKYALCLADAFALGPAYISSHLRAAGHETRYFVDPLLFSHGWTDNNWLSSLFSVEDYNIKKIKEYNPDAVLFSVITAQYQWALHLARKIKNQVGCKIIFGGIHPTSVPEIVKENKFIDEVVEGCGIKHFGLEFRPDEIFPERKDFFKELPATHRTAPYVMTDFGCPFSCSYCLPRELKIKQGKRSVDGCIRELKEIKAMGAVRIFFWDDTFIADKKWLDEFLDRYSEEIDLPFRCFGHSKLIDFITMVKLKNAGCYAVDIGIQTGNEELRRKVLDRHETNKEFLDACSCVKRAGMRLIFDHIFEIPGESDDTNSESYELYRKAKPDMVHCYQLIYFPRAKIIKAALDRGYLKPDDVDRINRGLHTAYASGEHTRVAKINPWVRRLLAIPLGGGLWEKMPDWIIKLACYIRFANDFMPQSVVQTRIFYTWRKLCRLI